MISSSNCDDGRLKRELRVDTPIGRGRSRGARLTQELLALNDVSVVIDGDLGPATEAGIAEFCRAQSVPVAATVDQNLMDRLAQPLLRAVAPVAAKPTLGATIVAIAKQHLKEHPVEVGGANAGPWVRLYMKGNEGAAFLWCAGFVTYIAAAAAKAHGQRSPYTSTFSCDALGAEAKANGRFRNRATPATATPGSLFLVPRPQMRNDWTHVGIITGGNGTVFNTIEGNTNDEGSREGFEVCARIRACANIDVITV